MADWETAVFTTHTIPQQVYDETAAVNWQEMQRAHSFWHSQAATIQYTPPEPPPQRVTFRGAPLTPNPGRHDYILGNAETLRRYRQLLDDDPPSGWGKYDPIASLDPRLAVGPGL